MSYRVIIPKPVQKQLQSLPESVHRRVLARLVVLADDPRPPGCVKLKGYNHEFRIRVGDYRVRYEVRDSESAVILLHCGNRKDIYRL